MMNERPTDVFLLKDGGCPPGTVPIRRVNENDDLSQTNVLPHQSVEGVNPNRGTEYISGTVYALGQTKSNPSKSYYGVGGVFSVYNPRALPSQYSSAEIILRGGSDTIIAGWTVNPSKYKDNRTRFFIYAVAGDLRCFSSECGFVIVRSDIPIDFALHPISKKGEKVYINKFFVYQEKPSGDWWLEVGATHPVALGFWPQRIFQGLNAPATYAACGGEISSIATLPPPEMGAGSYPEFAPALLVNSYCKDFVVVDETYTVVDVADSETYGNNGNYGVYDTHMRNKQHVVTFGGP
uniref:Neprosin PEP catalytic domain-containing protein n=2 Tax=Chenopodium quinoa TaxID=63459 RepID=A0A803LQL7_CHEQI